MRLLAPLTLLQALFLAAPASANGLLIPRDGSPPIAVKSHRVEAIVENGLARTTVRQTFVNPHGRPLEALYVFPLPESAALVEVAMEVGGQRLEGLLAERQRARKIYDEIVRSRRDPALVEQIGREAFRLSVFPVMPNQDTVVELSWIQRVPLTRGAFHYVYPLATAGPATRTEQDFTLTVILRSAVPFTEVTASSDDVEVIRRGPGEVLASLERSNALLASDVVLTAMVALEKPNLAVSTFRAAEGDGYFQVVITPPRAREDQLVPRDVILVLDTSGSMQGEKITQAKRSALWLLEHLRAADRVNVLRFSSDVQAFAEEPVPATAENLAALKGFVKAIEARGGTALGDALLKATSVAGAPGRARTVVLLSDGLPTIGEQDPAKLVALAKQSGDQGLRIFPFGVGEDLDSGLLRGIATAGRGRAELFRPGGEIATRLTSFLTRTSSPVISNIALSIEGPAEYDVFPRSLPDAYLGEQVTISGRYRGGGEGRVTVSATVGGERKSLATTLAFPAERSGSSSVKHLFARQKLDFLDEARRIRLGLGDDAYYAALDRGAYSTADEIVQEMVAVSIECGVQCAYTSFLVLLPEDRHRLDPHNAQALAEALKRAGEKKRGELEDFARREGEPFLRDAEIGDLYEIDDEQNYESTEGNPDFTSDSPFDDEAFNDSIGIGGGAGGKFGGRFGGRRNLRAAGGSGTEQALKDSFEWFARHQDADGKWDCDGFTKHCPPDHSCGGIGQPEHDVGVTGLCLLAFLGDGHTPRQGLYKNTVTRAVKWLREQQDHESGLIGEKVGYSYMYNHAIATLALCEAYYFSRSPLIRTTAQKAVDFLVRARNPYGVWRYNSPPVGDNDTSVTGWCIFALKSAQEAGLTVDVAAFDDALSWLDEVTDPQTGRVGYDSKGSTSSRVPGANDEYPTDQTEAMTAIGLLCRFFLGQDPAQHTVLVKHADLIMKSLPTWDPQGRTNDMYYWYYGSYAMFQMGGEHWKAWNQAMKLALLDPQRRDGCEKGSWDPIGPWGFSGGRLYSTALGTLSMEVYFRYAKVLGVR